MRGFEIAPAAGDIAAKLERGCSQKLQHTVARTLLLIVHLTQVLLRETPQQGVERVRLRLRFSRPVRLRGPHSPRVGNDTVPISTRPHVQFIVGNAEAHGILDSIVPPAVAYGEARSGAANLQHKESETLRPVGIVRKAGL